MSRWNQEAVDVKLIANYVPVCSEDWGKTGSCIIHTEDPFSFSKRLPRNKPYNLSIEVYSPDSKFPFDNGELEHVGCKIEEGMDSFSYELKRLEIPGENLRRLYFNEAVTYTIGTLYAGGWWWLFMINPLLVAAGLPNYLKNRHAKRIPNYNKRRIITGKEQARIDAINESFEFHESISENDYKKRLHIMIDFCSEKEKKNPAYKEISQAYRDVLKNATEDSPLLKKIPKNYIDTLKRFFINPYGIIAEEKVPSQLINVRNLHDKSLERYLDQWQK